jgi:TM2 domain-containing membrane protein YozV
MEKVWEIKDPDSYLRKKTVVRKGPPVAEKDPAKAYSLSLLCWGGGQLYNNQLAKASVFLITMVLLLVFTVLGATNSAELLKFLHEKKISLSDAFLYAEIALFFIILIWVFNAGDAYHFARRTRRTPFRGVNSKLTPILGSLVLPGWGQFLNGQQLKGSIYAGLSVVSIFSVLSVVLTFLAWPMLDASDTRFLAEGISAVCLIIVPFIPFLWLFSAYDALMVSLDDLKKEPLWERIKAAYYRGRSQGWVRGVFPQIKGTFLLVLVLAFFVIIVHYYWFPKEFYTEQLMSVKQLLSERGMTIVPGLIDRLLMWIVGAGR